MMKEGAASLTSEIVSETLDLQYSRDRLMSDEFRVTNHRIEEHDEGLLLLIIHKAIYGRIHIDGNKKGQPG